MLHGTVKYGLKSGGESGLDWAARAHLVKVDGKVKMDFYQVYLVSCRCPPTLFGEDYLLSGVDGTSLETFKVEIGLTCAQDTGAMAK